MQVSLNKQNEKGEGFFSKLGRLSFGILIGIVIGIAGSIVFFLLLRSCRGEQSVSTLPDTSSTMEVDSSGNVTPPPLPEGSGKSDPTARVKYRLRFVVLPIWRISAIDYRDGVLKFVAEKPIMIDDTTVNYDVVSETHYAPGNFQVKIGEDIRVDTFPRKIETTPTAVARKKWLRLSGLAEYDSEDGLGAGIEVSAWRMVRLQGLFGVSRALFPSDSLAPWVRFRLQIAIP